MSFNVDVFKLWNVLVMINKNGLLIKYVTSWQKTYKSVKQDGLASVYHPALNRKYLQNLTLFLIFIIPQSSFNHNSR